MPSRRHIILASAGLVSASALPAFACSPPTERQTEGPFFRGGSPLRVQLASPNQPGTRIALSGQVLGRDCRPIPGAMVDIWHADAAGSYDMSGYNLRGHQITDTSGAWRFETIEPARYVGRTRHYHVRVMLADGRSLTSQLYFPGDTGNARDGLYRPSLQMAINGNTARFDFVLAA
jgi:protocatechuate 3,4-dioxygenase beta subunit